MDSKDFRLLVALYADARQSYQSLGRRVGLSAPVVRERLKRLESRGILLGFGLYLDPGRFDRDELLVFFRGRNFARKEVERALAAQEVGWVGWKLEGGLTVSLWTRDRAAARRRISEVMGAEPSGEGFTKSGARPRLSSVDLSIIDSLIDEPKIPLKMVLQKTGLSPKTVRRHLAWMLEDSAIFIEPRLGAIADSGELVYQLAVTGDVPTSEVVKVMGEAVLIQQTQEPPMRYVLCRGSDLGDVTTKTRTLEGVPRVESVSISLNRALFISTGFEHALVREAMKELEISRIARG
jgi:DNA-binding Lrp family transcriptional regulator